MDAGAGGVQAQLAHGDAHAVDAQVAEAEDARAIGHDGDLDVVRPVLDDGVQVALVLEREVHALGLRVQLRPALARFADRGGVDEGGQVLYTRTRLARASAFLRPTATLGGLWGGGRQQTSIYLP